MKKIPENFNKLLVKLNQKKERENKLLKLLQKKLENWKI